MFGNEFDKQFNAGADFGTYDQHFIYGGLGNPGKLIAPHPGAIPSMQFGYYMPWKLPMSFFASLNGTAFGSRAVGKTVTTWDDLKHTKKQAKTKTSYYMQPLFATSNFQFQYLIGIGTGMNITTGVQFAYDGNNSGWTAANNTKVVMTDYINKSNSAKQYGKNITKTEKDNRLTEITTALTTGSMPDLKGIAESMNAFAFRIPVSFSTGSLNHVAALYLGSTITSNNAYYYFKQNKTEETFKVTNLKSFTTLKGEYTVEIPAADRDGDSWEVGGSIGLEFTNQENRWKYDYQDGTAANKKTAKYKHTKAPGLGLSMNVTGARMLKFASPKQTVLFNMKPTLSFDLNTYMDDGAGRLYGYNSKISGEASWNGNKYVYKQTTKGDADQYKNKTEFTSTASVPMGLKIVPENWKVGFLLGATPEVKHTITATWDRTKKHKAATTTGGMTVNGTTPPTPPAGAPYPSVDDDVTVSRTDSWTFSEKHSIGLTIPFEGGAHLDMEVTGSLLNFNNFKIQAFIPLGTGKKAASAQ